MESFGSELRRQRRRLGLSLDDVQRLTGISKPYLSLVETGKTRGPPSDEKLQKLEVVLKFPPGSLVAKAHWARTPADVRAVVGRLLGGLGAADAGWLTGAPTGADVTGGGSATGTPPDATLGSQSPPLPGLEAATLERQKVARGAEAAAPGSGKALAGEGTQPVAAELALAVRVSGRSRSVSGGGPWKHVTAEGGPDARRGGPGNERGERGRPGGGDGAVGPDGRFAGSSDSGGAVPGGTREAALGGVREAARRAGGPWASLDEAYRSGRLADWLDRRVGNVEPAVCGRVPLINRVSAGYPREFTDLGYPARVADDAVPAPASDDRHQFAAKVCGDSMFPAYADGDIVVFSPDAAVHNGSDCFVRLDDGYSTFKRVYFERDADGAEVVRLQPVNRDFTPTVVPATRVAGIYRAVWVMRAVAAVPGDAGPAARAETVKASVATASRPRPAGRRATRDGKGV